MLPLIRMLQGALRLVRFCVDLYIMGLGGQGMVKGGIWTGEEAG